MTPAETPTDQIAAIYDEIEKVDSVITTAQRLLADGKIVDLSALEGRAESLCDQIIDADVDSTDDISQALRDVLGKLERLGEELVAQHEAAGGDISDMPVKKAIDAYEKDS